ncbi:MAG: VPLPA-CTERM sorting domain-containing protein [Pikeienuella sp.]|uniref:VPLPA-CTERM sorting domain-containing protein n=1 Tax=Pikeienuella sp. TaxID=2831957 RepID=UPI00391952E4
MKKSLAGLALGVCLFAAHDAAATTVFATQIDSGRTGAAELGFTTTPVDNTNRAAGGNALGAPDATFANSGGGFYSLGLGGAAVFGFGVDFGTQATVFEVTFGCTGPQSPNGTCSFVETADVYALAGGYTPFDGAFGLSDLLSLGFQKVGSIPNGVANTAGGATIAISGPFSWLALVDTSPFVNGRDGFDVDAVSVSAVPLPASILFLLGGLGGLGLLRARRAA